MGHETKRHWTDWLNGKVNYTREIGAMHPMF